MNDSAARLLSDMARAERIRREAMDRYWRSVCEGVTRESSEWPCTADRRCMASHHHLGCPIRYRGDVEGEEEVSIRDDYPAMTTLADACAERVDEACPEAVRAWRELDRLRQWRDDALNELSEWDTVHAEVAGASAHLGRTKAENVRREMHRLRGQCEVWKNGVADVVEPWGYDREAACGPADLLPGLTELARRLRECVEARRHLYARSETGTLDEGGGLMSEETRSPAVSPNEAAAILGVSRQTVHALINRGELRRFKVGRLTRIPRGDVLALVGGAL